jgi:hypothetical protein
MRRLVLFVLSVAMLIGGLYLLAAELLWAQRIFVWAILAAGMLITLGAYLLWADFIAAPLGIQRDNK